MTARRPIAILSATQLISWGMLYYAFGVLASHMQKDLGLSAGQIFGAFSVSVLVAGLASTPIGMAIDKHGGRWMMVAGSLMAALGLWALSIAQSAGVYFAAWMLIGLAMALTLYEAAFATLNRALSLDAARAISTVTLAGGLASTAFWPLTDILFARLGWRDTLAVYAVVQLLVCAPLHFMLGAPAARLVHHKAQPGDNGHTLAQAIATPGFWLLSSAFAAVAFVFSALSVHMIRILGGLGHASEFVLILAASIGPMQVAGRLIERAWGGRTTPQVIGIYTFSALPSALLVLALFGSKGWGVALFCVLYGLGNGVLTIVRGTLPAAMFGRAHYGAISGALAAPALLAKAAGPTALALALDLVDVQTFLFGLCGLAVVSLALFWFSILPSRQSLRVAPGEPT